MGCKGRDSELFRELLFLHFSHEQRVADADSGKDAVKEKALNFWYMCNIRHLTSTAEAQQLQLHAVLTAGAALGSRDWIVLGRMKFHIFYTDNGPIPGMDPHPWRYPRPGWLGLWAAWCGGE